MKASELVKRFKDFQGVLVEHRTLWGNSISSGGIDPGVYKNHAKLEEQRRALAGMLGVLNPYINRYALVRMSALYGRPYDIFLTAVLDDPVAMRKSMAFNEAVPILDAIIGRLETERADAEIADQASAKRQARLFIAHGKATAALQQIERFVRDLGMEPIMVKDEPSRGGAVDDVVPALMSSCDVAIILATADDDVDGKFQARQNVSHEIGLAQQMLNDRLIYLKEEPCDFPTNVNPKLWENFTQQNVAPAYSKIVKELRAFGLL